MINKIQKRHIIKIPKNTTILYCKKKKILTVIGSKKKKSLKLNINIEILNSKKIIKVTKIPFLKISNNAKKKLKSIQGTTTSIIKQTIIETNSIFYKKLKLIGVGYKVFAIEPYENKLLLFKLGYSHKIYCGIPKEFYIHCLKAIKLYVYGSSYKKLTQLTSLIQLLKKPEPYKGKGILYENQKIKLKEGKKV
jgi:large subunit ribosomal protein L6